MEYYKKHLYVNHLINSLEGDFFQSLVDSETKVLAGTSKELEETSVYLISEVVNCRDFSAKGEFFSKWVEITSNTNEDNTEYYFDDVSLHLKTFYNEQTFKILVQYDSESKRLGISVGLPLLTDYSITVIFDVDGYDENEGSEIIFSEDYCPLLAYLNRFVGIEQV